MSQISGTASTLVGTSAPTGSARPGHGPQVKAPTWLGERGIVWCPLQGTVFLHRPRHTCSIMLTSTPSFAPLSAQSFHRAPRTKRRNPPATGCDRDLGPTWVVGARSATRCDPVRPGQGHQFDNIFEGIYQGPGASRAGQAVLPAGVAGGGSDWEMRRRRWIDARLLVLRAACGAHMAMCSLKPTCLGRNPDRSTLHSRTHVRCLWVYSVATRRPCSTGEFFLMFYLTKKTDIHHLSSGNVYLQRKKLFLAGSPALRERPRDPARPAASKAAILLSSAAECNAGQHCSVYLQLAQ